MKQCGVYKITNLITGMIYIGASRDVLTRWKAHKSMLRLGRHHVPQLQEDWNLLGEDKFSFEIVEKCSARNLLVTEQKHIEKSLASHIAYNKVVVNYSPNADSRLTDDAAARLSKWLNKVGVKVCKADCVYESVNSLLNKLILPKEHAVVRADMLTAAWGSRVQEAVNE